MGGCGGEVEKEGRGRRESLRWNFFGGRGGVGEGVRVVFRIFSCLNFELFWQPSGCLGYCRQFFGKGLVPGTICL